MLNGFQDPVSIFLTPVVKPLSATKRLDPALLPSIQPSIPPLQFSGFSAERQYNVTFSSRICNMIRGVY
jgi:hypothetical protein